MKLRQIIAVWLIKKIQKYGPHRVQVLGKTYEVSQEVFNPKFYYTSEFMARHINVTPRDEVLDMGTGCGIQAITAGEKAERVVAIDINPQAVRFARKNVANNGLEDKVLVIQGDLFSPLHPRQKFDIILFTPPYIEGVPKTDFDHALFDPGKKLIRRFFSEAGNYLKPNGYVQMVYSSIADPERVLEISRGFGWRNSLIAQGKTFMEKFLIYKLTLYI
jgi:release factor glutamine methyltransferase